jgi:hypothetical protein
MAEARFLPKRSPVRPLREDLAGKTLFAEYAKVEEIDRRKNKSLLQEVTPAVALPANVEKLPLLTTDRDERTAEAEDGWNESAEHRVLAKTLTEVMSGLDIESDLFYAKTKMFREYIETDEE